MCVFSSVRDSVSLSLTCTGYCFRQTQSSPAQPSRSHQENRSHHTIHPTNTILSPHPTPHPPLIVMNHSEVNNQIQQMQMFILQVRTTTARDTDRSLTPFNHPIRPIDSIQFIDYIEYAVHHHHRFAIECAVPPSTLFDSVKSIRVTLGSASTEPDVIPSMESNPLNHSTNYGKQIQTQSHTIRRMIWHPA